ncbi:50S ribosomal protein L13 [Candidatus Saccharibacteria bacterium]|nr:50S ribosomal protein L13 [Candidatus Saccharibacteria bacterium]
MKTYSAKPEDVTRAWHEVDATEAPLGRVATVVATLLTGKGKPSFTKHIDCGDFVVVINAADLVVTGDKKLKKVYYKHSHYPGGLRQKTLQEQLDQDPTEVIFKAVRGMLPVNKLRDGRLARLKIYAGSEHQHAPQKPQKYSVKEGK